MKRFLLSVLTIITMVNFSAQAQPTYKKSVEMFANIGVGEYPNSMFGAAFINGFQLGEKAFVGLGVGVGYMSEVSYVEIVGNYERIRRSDAYPVPVFLVGKYALSTNKIAPYVAARVGYTLDINEYIQHAPGLMFEPAVGVNIDINETQSVYAQLGLNFQKGTYNYQKDVYDVLGDWEIAIKEDMFKAISFRVGFFF